VELPGSLLNIVWRDDGGATVLTEESGSSTPNERTRNLARIQEVNPGSPPREIVQFSAMEWMLVLTDAGVRVERPWYFPQTLSAANQDGFWFTHGTEWKVERRDPRSGGLTHLITFDEPRVPFTLDVDVPVPAMEPPDSIPPIARLYADRQDRLWVGIAEGRYSALPSGMGRVVSRWKILSAEGDRILGQLALPEGRRLLYSDTDGVLLVGVDEVDVPVIEWVPFAGQGP
jgi:hypothetical protein